MELVEELEHPGDIIGEIASNSLLEFAWSFNLVLVFNTWLRVLALLTTLTTLKDNGEYFLSKLDYTTTRITIFHEHFCL